MSGQNSHQSNTSKHYSSSLQNHKHGKSVIPSDGDHTSLQRFISSSHHFGQSRNSNIISYEQQVYQAIQSAKYTIEWIQRLQSYERVVDRAIQGENANNHESEHSYKWLVDHAIRSTERTYSMASGFSYLVDLALRSERNMGPRYSFEELVNNAIRSEKAHSTKSKTFNRSEKAHRRTSQTFNNHLSTWQNSKRNDK
ncbi:hypothetical protein GLYMA_03G058600v4 [Glycine max]|uniref:Uncharacterized protein n=2 Tax=Glycine subgen. Soja TaxID=1462606 RepID=K7KDB6_SOYBN|nr:hypothetical protein GYH30_006350 [Glycine max]KAH1256649.1 hypothetical protein GmHk_03G006760 [Glycine max]KHN42497.1 hypothetical protein glysoja_031433 [Glycine soja]KRH65745.1 hypothetical protein GLYMA_03G058600v4 [Glycine max]RZC19309.1 hypothetical protein D0Y65_006215 [Glycine soja]